MSKGHLTWDWFWHLVDNEEIVGVAIFVDTDQPSYIAAFRGLPAFTTKYAERYFELEAARRAGNHEEAEKIQAGLDKAGLRLVWPNDISRPSPAFEGRFRFHISIGEIWFHPNFGAFPMSDANSDE